MPTYYTTTSNSYYDTYSYDTSWSPNTSGTSSYSTSAYSWSGFFNFDNNNDNIWHKPEPVISQDEFDEIF